MNAIDAAVAVADDFGNVLIVPASYFADVLSVIDVIAVDVEVVRVHGWSC